MESWDKVIDLSCRKEGRDIYCSKEVIILYYLDSHNLFNYIIPFQQVVLLIYLYYLLFPFTSIVGGGGQYYLIFQEIY